MNSQPIPTDTPGIFRCPICGLQNPRPIKKPFIHQCRNAKPEPAPEPRTLEEIAYIIDVICPGCRWYNFADKTCACCDARGRGVATLAAMPAQSCPACRW